MRRIITITLLFCAIVQGYSQKLNTQLRQHVEYLCSDALAGRAAGSEGERKAAEYLYNQLSKAGVTMISKRSGDEFRIVNNGDTILSRNVIGIIEGYDSSVRNEFIVVGAHYDNLGTYDITVDGKRYTKPFQGADANASGVAALIEVADMLCQNAIFLRRSVILVGFGAGEREMAGSRHFVSSDGFGDNSAIKLMIDLDMLGRGNAANPFQIYSLINRNDINALMSHVKSNESVTLQPTFFNGTFFSSDYLPFSTASVPYLMFSTGKSKEYHTARDTYDLIDFENLAAESIYIAAFVKSAAIKEELYPSRSVSLANADRVYAPADCNPRPQFFHSDESHFLNTWVYKYLNYPQDAIREGIQGKVMVSFIIEKDGSVTNVKIEDSVYDSLDDEVLRIVSVSPKWIPGQINGRKVRTRMVLPVEFRLKRR